MGWGGSVQTMLNTLKANKELLHKRKKYFGREPRFGKIRKRYEKASKALINKEKPSEYVLDQIREKLRKDRKRAILTTVVISIITTTAILILVFAFYKNYTFKMELEKLQSEEIKQIQNLRAYNKEMQLGQNQIENGDFFFAAGSFERALAKIPNDSSAQYQLAYSYCLLCAKKEKGCHKANDLIEDLIEEHPRSIQYEMLKSNYLTPKNTN